MANRFVFPNQQWFDGNGNPGAGWQLGFFKPGTSTRKDTYTTEALSTPNKNPVVADANGVWPDIWMDGSYDIRLLDENDAQKEFWNNVAGPLFNAIGSGADDIPTNAYVGSFVPSIVDSGTDAYQADFGRDVSAGEKVTGDVGSPNETTTPAMANTGGTPGSLTITTKDGSALWADALSGVHTFQLAASSWLVLDPNPVSANSANAPVERDSNGRAKFADPSAAQDAATKASSEAYADTHGAFATRLLHVQDQKPGGTQGGSSVDGTLSRDLNTVLTNEIAGASLSSNMVTLPSGSYWVEGSAPAFRSQSHKTFFQNADAGSNLLIGTSEYAGSHNSGDDVSTRSFFSGRITLASETDLTVRHFFEIAESDNGLGTATDTSAVEVYTDLRIWKVG